MDVIKIPLDKLVMSSEDVAVRQHYDGKAIKALAQNIKHFGLLQPLLVRVKGENYEVIDGNRRLLALQVIDADPHRLVICVVDSEQELGKGQALSANIMREDMNPMDIYDVYQDLIKSGTTEKAIAKAFNKSKKQIAQILALANLHPEVKEQLRSNSIGWETAQALTSIRNQDRQVAVLSEAGDSDWRVREILGRSAPNLAHALFDRDEYLKRGGTIIIDLFSEQQDNKPQLCEDKDLFWELQNAAVDKHIEALVKEGWLTVVNANDGERIKIDMNWPWRESITTKKQRKLHTLYYEVDGDGEFVVHNRVKPVAKLVEKAKAETLKKKIEEGIKIGEPVEMTGNRPMSQTLVEQLKHIRNVQVKAALALHPTLAARVLVLMLMQGRGGQRYGATATDLFWSACKPLPGSFEQHEAWATQQGKYEQLGNEMISDGWTHVMSESGLEILERLGYIATMAINAHYPGAGELINAILQQQPIQAREVWQPKAEFWKQTGRAFMLKILGEITGETVASRFKNEKVVELARRMERWFCEPDNLRWLDFGGKDEPLHDEVKERFRSWAPAILAVPDKAMRLGDIFHEETSEPINYEIDDEKQAEAEEVAAAEE